MALAFLLLFPIGAVTARYFRSTFQPRQWFKVIIIINVKCIIVQYKTLVNKTTLLVHL